ALQADTFALEDCGKAERHLRLADTGRAFQKQRLAELERQVERGDERLVGEIAGIGKRRGELVFGQRRGHGTAFRSRGSSPSGLPPVSRPWRKVRGRRRRDWRAH